MTRVLGCAPYLLACAIGAAVMAYLPDAIATWQKIAALLKIAGPYPIEVFAQEGRRDPKDPYVVLFTSQGAVWNKECPWVQISREWGLKGGRNLPAEVEVLSGPLKGVQTTPRYVLAITPQTRTPSLLRARIPAWVDDPGEIISYNTFGMVPASKPCKDGWYGAWRISGVAIPPP